MKNIIVLLGCMVLLQGCTKDEAPVRQVAQSYLEARLSGDFATAGTWVTDASKVQLEDLEMFMITESGAELPGRFTVGKVIFSGNHAAVVYELAGYGEDTLDLVWLNETWKVDLSGPSAVPDAGVLWQDLRELEGEDTTARELRAIDRMLFQEDSLIETMPSSHDEAMQNDTL